MPGTRSRHGPGARSVERLEQLLAAAAVLLLPTVHDPLSAWLCEMAGFEAVLVSRRVVAMAVLASDDPAAAEDEVVTGRVAEICRVVTVPVVVDLTPAAPPRRLRPTVAALAMSGAAGVVIDDLDGDGLLPLASFRERLAAARDGLDRRGLDLVVAARTLAATRGASTPDAALERLAALRPLWQLGAVDGLEPGDLPPDSVPWLLAVDRDGAPGAVRRAERAGFRAYSWNRPLLTGAVSGMRRLLAGFDDDGLAERPDPAGGHVPAAAD